MGRKVTLLWLGLAIFICMGAPQSMGYAQAQQPSAANSLEQHKALVRRWIEEGFNNKDLKVVDELFVEDFVVNGRNIGRRGLKQSMNRRLTAFPDLHVTIVEIIAEGDKVAMWYTVQATQKGEYEGVPPTGKQVNWFGADFLRVREGKIIEGRFVDDSLGLRLQLGATVSSSPIQ